MNWAAIIEAVIVGAVSAFRKLRPAKPWRWGHAFSKNEDVVTCLYCLHEVPFRQRVTSPPCEGPSEARAKELRAQGIRRL